MRLLSGIVFVLVTGCGAIMPVAPFPFVPAATSVAGAPALIEYERVLRAQIGLYEQERLRHLAGIGDSHDFITPDWLLPGMRAAQEAADGHDGGRIAPVALRADEIGPQRYDGRWRSAEAYFYLSHEGPAQGATPFRFSGLNALTTEVYFRSATAQDMQVDMLCDGPVKLHEVERSHAFATGRDIGFVIAGGDIDQTRLEIAAQTTFCTLDISRPGRAGVRQLRMEREEIFDPVVTAIDQRYDVCAVPAQGQADPVADAFFAGRWLTQTCALDPADMRLLSEARDGFNAKVQALTGTTLPDAAFDLGDPLYPLDFARAPQLDLIYLSYLDLKADFSGAIIERALRFHAARGTRIRIIVTESLASPKDLDLITALAADFPNVQLQLFMWEPVPFASFEDHFDRLHRTHHVKLFLAISPDPSRSRAILGGRNIHDGFLFQEALDLSAYPELTNYGTPSEFSLAYFSSYHDFETEIRSDTAVRTLAAHLATYWHRDHVTNVFRPYSVSGTVSQGGVAAAGMRHFISVPYQDGRALERYYIELINSARTSIQIVSPYLNPTPSIEAALNRAHDRGVQITIVARIRLYGDLGGRLMTEMNMLFVEKYADRFTIYEYEPEDQVLHTKLLLIDRSLSVVTSTNLNRRSFFHDSENGIIVLSPAFYRQVNAVVDGYIAQAVRLSPTDIAIRESSRRLFESERVRDLF